MRRQPDFIFLRSPTFSLKDINENTLSKSSIFDEALFVASKDLYDEIHYEFPRDIKKQSKVNSSLIKYWIRACTRCTPFGLFAGGLMVNLTENPTSLILKENNAHIKKARLDMICLEQITHKLLKIPEVREKVIHFPNDSLYEINQEYRYIEYEINNGEKKYKLSSIPKTEYLEKILDRANKGCNIVELTKYLAQIESVEEEDALEYIVQLSDAQILISDIEPNITGDDPLSRLIGSLKMTNLPKSILDRMLKVQSILESSNPNIEDYQNIRQEIDFFDIDTKNILQVDLTLAPETVNVNKDLITEIVEQLNRLLVLKIEGETMDLRNFKDKFFEKYGYQNVPLSLVMDSEFGIGYSYLADGHQDKSSMIDDLTLRNKKSIDDEYHTFNYIQKLAFTKFNEYLESSEKIIEITEQDLKNIEPFTKDLEIATSLYTMGNLHSKNGRIDKDNFLYDLILIGGPCAATLLGRFTCDDPELLNGIRRYLKEEEDEYPDAIFAEIVHLPQARVGNILRRPILRDYEISYLGHSGIERENNINIQDLSVSIENDQVVLRSYKHNKRVIPRLTTAHNFMVGNLPLYKFLCDLQTQGNSYAAFWDWGLLDNIAHLPRVMYKNVIIKRARWIIKEKQVREISKNTSITRDGTMLYLQKYGIPLKVGLVQGQNEFLLDLDSERGFEIFKEFLNKHSAIEVREYLFDEENCIVRDVNGKPYTNEIVIPITQNVVAKRDLGSFQARTTPAKKFYLGSEWLYFKIYASHQVIFEILTDVVLPFLEKNNQILFEKFFYIRYFDTSNHLRVRFYNSDVTKLKILQDEFIGLLEVFYAAGKISNINVDIYERENSRYDERLIDQAESLFFNDSVFAIKSIMIFSDYPDEISIYLRVIKSIDVLMSDFKLDIQEKYELLKILQKSFFEEFGGHKILQKQLNEKFRKYKDAIVDTLSDEANHEFQNDLYSEILNERSLSNIRPISEILEKISIMQGDLSLFKLLPSYIHMSINRIFESNQRKHELIIYHLLERHYRSVVSQKNNIG
ncbi:thiopeptide-type bacteriocin biosynthesis domain-containing protein [Pedobacter terrae]|uniref:Thiopeptide-type bacteriocin biosynthesis domain-containing protein n=1 Tax=Pedobacter terrae TaxID=405671 RepID=A0A1G8CJP9_9SPHI|nr:lantibiotic dehydratase [Pedobacter terrae]SDH45569.1 thiopeptide-type bacteriocin biosynthesis domain-containing protein [Pedobacter terrae]